MSAPLGQMMIDAGFINQEQLQDALSEQRSTGLKLGSVLSSLGHSDQKTVSSFLSTQFGVPCIELDEVEVEPSVLELIPKQMARRYKLLPIERSGIKLTVAMAEPTNVTTQDDIKFLTGYIVEPMVATEAAIDAAIGRCYRGSNSRQKPQESLKAEIDISEYDLEDEDIRDVEAERSTGPVLDVDEFDSLVQGAVDNVEVLEDEDDSDLVKMEVDAPIIKLVNGILIKAYKMKASDIHIEPFERLVRIRYRLDGICRTMMNLPLKIRNPVVSRIKIMAKLDIAERRVPQDGRIKMKLGRRAQVDFRVSVLPSIFGEKVVLRLLDKSALHLDMTRLGFDEQVLQCFQEAIHRPNGMVLVTGPTGSGKTTTLYSALAELNTDEVNIVTVEDPVEYNLVGITQVEVKERIGLGFASSLRTFLRQDPDIILIGEIRDYETTKIAVRSALTGHLVLSTLHTNDAATAVTRLVNMGVEPFLVAYSLQLVVAQRLVRRVCESCKNEVEMPLQMLRELGFNGEQVASLTCYQGGGCDTCRGTGYRGRIALYEVLPMTDEIRQLVLAGDSGLAVKQAALKNGMQTLRMSGLQKLEEGVTTVEEVLRVTC
jgi:type IV pilus assembly protein PilB